MIRKFLSMVFILTCAALAVAQGDPARTTGAPSPPVQKTTPPAAPHTFLKVGQPAPDITLPSTIVGPDKKTVRYKLSDFKGKKNVVLAFYIFAFTGG